MMPSLHVPCTPHVLLHGTHVAPKKLNEHASHVAPIHPFWHVEHSGKAQFASQMHAPLPRTPSSHTPCTHKGHALQTMPW
jgi:hypothetical protein